jgi:hypothetical protein
MFPEYQGYVPMCSAYISTVSGRSAEAYNLIRFIAVTNPQPYYTDIYMRYFSIPVGEKYFFHQTSKWLWGYTLHALHCLLGGGRAKQPALEDDHSLLPRLRISDYTFSPPICINLTP